MAILSIKPKTRISNLGLNLTVTLPSTPVVLKTDVFGKDYARIDFTDTDDLYNALVEAATLYVQKILNRALITQTLTAEWDSVGYEVPLPYYVPGASITSLKTVNDEGTKTALTQNSNYYFRNGILKVGTSLGLEAIYTSGYGAASSDVPQPIKLAIGRIVLGLYDRRDDEIMESNIDQLAMNSMTLLAPYINHDIW